MADKPSEYRIQHNGHEWLFPDITLAHGFMTMTRHSFLERNDALITIVDGGACVGGFALAMLDVLPNAEFEMFEPWSECWPYLEYNMRGHKVNINKFALGKNNGSVPIGYKDSDKRMGKVAIGRNGTTAVPVKPLDMVYTRDRLDLLKLDIEGYELNALIGAKETIQKFSPLLLVEILPQHQDRSVFEFLHTLDYTAELKVWVNDYLFAKHG